MRKIIEILFPAMLGISILLTLSHQVDVYSSFLVESSTRPQLFPKLMAWLMIIISGTNLIGFFMKTNMEMFTGKVVIKKEAFFGMGLLSAYAGLMPVLGFIASTILCMIGAIYLLGKIVWYKAALFAGITTILIWYTFAKLLKIPLPSGWII